MYLRSTQIWAPIRLLGGKWLQSEQSQEASSVLDSDGGWRTPPVVSDRRRSPCFIWGISQDARLGNSLRLCLVLVLASSFLAGLSGL